MSKEQQHYKYFAFISYNSKDTVWGKRVQRKLEGYRMPSTLCSEHGWARKPIKPVFFAPTDIQPGGLTAELQETLREHLRRGDRVELIDIGTFKLELESHAVDSPSDFQPSKHIRRPVLRVLPKCKAGKPQLYQDMEYEKWKD